MSSTIISNSSVSQEQILNNIQEFVKTLPNYGDIRDNLNTSTMSVIYQLLAGFSSWSFYQYQMARTETYLSTAIQDKSIYTISRQLGYNLDRGMSPTIVCKYDSVATISLKSGDVVGRFNGIDLVYFGSQRFVEKGDEIVFCLGKYRVMDSTIQNSATSLVRDRVSAESLRYIDNLRVSVSVGRDVYTPTKQVEDFVVKGRVIDFSVTPNSTDIYIMDSEYKYGLFNLQDGTPYRIEFLEINGYEPNISVDDIEMYEGWVCLSVSSQGSNPEPTSKLKVVAPFYYSTMRRAVTRSDYDYLSKANSLVLDTYVDREKGTPGVFTVQFKSVPVVENDIFTVSIRQGVVYSYKAKNGDSIDIVRKNLVESMNIGGWVIASSEGSDTIRIENADARLDLSPNASSNKFNTPVEVVRQVTPLCCTLNLYYIKFNQTRDLPIQVLTVSERDLYAEYIQSFKMAGTSIVMIPAGRESHDIKLRIGVTDKTLVLDNGESLVDFIKNEVRDILDEYELKLNKGFSYSEFIAKVTKLSVNVGFDKIQPIVSVSANQDVFDLSPVESKYYIFPNIDIEFV